MNETKKCTCCEEVKPLTAFHRQWQSRDGRMSKCRTCRSVSYSKKAVQVFDEVYIDETLESILDEIRSDQEEIRRAKINGWSGGDPDIEVVCKARTETFKTLLNELFDVHKLSKKIIANGTIERVNREIKIRLKKRKNG